MSDYAGEVGQVMTGFGLGALLAALVLSSVLGLWLRNSGRRLGDPAAAEADVPRLGSADLGADLGERATLVQFSSAFCQPCRATRRILDDVARDVSGVAHVEIDAESHLDLVRRLDVRRTPTVLVLDATGRIVRRASGQPRRVDVIAALGEAVS
jgi:thiol-disulfide isomerase/thioredoxin